MKKILNIKLCENIINSDFFLSNHNKTSSINLLTFIKELKQFIRILHFIKRCDSKQIFFSLVNEQDVFLFNNYLNNSIAFNLSFSINNRLSSIKLSKSQVGLLISLTAIKNKNLLKTCINKKLFLSIFLNKINFHTKVLPTYKVLTDFDTLKKKIFLISILEKTLSTI
jgi:hypothetical protein